MDFSFTEEQTLLRNSVSKFLADNYKFEFFKKNSRTDPGWSPSVWKQFAELGLMAAPLPEEHGGLGGDAVDTMIVTEELGRSLVVEPYVQTVVVGGGFIGRGTEAQKAFHLPRILSGQSWWCQGFSEPKQHH